MKKIIDFIKNNCGYIIGTIAILFFCATVVIPFFVALGRVAWDVAINDPWRLI